MEEEEDIQYGQITSDRDQVVLWWGSKWQQGELYNRSHRVNREILPLLTDGPVEFETGRF